VNWFSTALPSLTRGFSIEETQKGYANSAHSELSSISGSESSSQSWPASELASPSESICPAAALQMGLVGFGNAADMESVLRTRQHPSWRVADVADADALWLNGSHAQATREQTIRVPSGRVDQPAFLLRQDDTSRPIAFTLPLRDSGFKPAYASDPQRPDSAGKVLESFEALLRPLAIKLALAQQLMQAPSCTERAALPRLPRAVAGCRTHCRGRRRVRPRPEAR
jgi:hypothetical protein